MSSRCWRLCDLEDMVERLLATVKALPEGSLIRDPQDPVELSYTPQQVQEMLEDMLDQLWIDQRTLD